jgi:ring-1,2-phenylacetyl-CoA epoxidase subunit PaaE
MSTHFYPLIVKDIRKETADCVSVAFEVPEAHAALFQYQAGQYITLRANINGAEIRRSYSICSSPLDGELRVAIKKVAKGIFSTYANEQLKKGDTIEVMSPNGRFFTALDAKQHKHYVAFAAGSGITPIMAIIKTTLQTEPHSTFTLVYGNKNRHSIIFKEALEGLKNKYMQRFSLLHILSREKADTPLNSGRIDALKCESLFNKTISIHADEYFICGPEAMIHSVKNYLETKGVDRKKIHVELFTAAKKVAAKQETTTTTNAVAMSTITVKLDGSSFDFDLAFDGNSILDAAMQQGADLPYACKGGVCCTCKAKLIAGEVEMDVNWGLEPEEVEQGFILTCQSHPKTAKVVVDFDAR